MARDSPCMVVWVRARGEHERARSGQVYTWQPMALSDTDDKARAAQLAVLRRLGPAERVRMAAEMSEELRSMAFEAEQRRHPELSEADARQAVLDRMWGPELAAAVRAARAVLR